MKWERDKGEQDEESGFRFQYSWRKIWIGVVAVFLLLFFLTGITLLCLYKLGEHSIKAQGESLLDAEVQYTTGEALSVSPETQHTSPQRILAWQEDWLVYEGKVYEYREDTLNFLLIGIDVIGELSKETNTANWDAGQADTIFLISLNQEDYRVSFIGIPRNAMVDLEIFDESGQCVNQIYNQICLQYAYAGGGELGMEKMKERVSELFNQIPIHGCCAVGFDVLGVLVEKLGGIEVVIPDDMTRLNPEYTQGGTLILNQENIIPYLRYRDIRVLGTPTVRLQRQKQFLQTIVEEGLRQVKQKPMLISQMYKAMEPYMNTDISLDEAVYLGVEALTYKFDSNSFYQLAGEDREVVLAEENGTEECFNDLYLDENYLQKILVDIFYQPVQVE